MLSMRLCNKKTIIFCFAFFINGLSYNEVAPDTAPLITEPQTAPANEWIIFDGVRHLSYNMVMCLVNNKIPCTVVVRPADLFFADSRLPKSPLITLVAIDIASTQATKALDAVGAGAKYLFLDPEWDDYQTWHSSVLTITRNALHVAKKQNLTLFYPGKIYAFGHPTLNTITEDSYFKPSSAQGLTLSSIEGLLQQASHKKECKVRIVRISYAFGPAVYDYLLSSTFKDMPSLGRMTWLFRTDKPHQFCYAYDVARLILILSTAKPDPFNLTIHFSGYTYESVEAFGHDIGHAAGKQLKQRTVSKFQLNLVCYVEPNAERGADLTAYFEQPVYLEDSDLIFKEFNFLPTPPHEAIKATLDWFSINPHTRSMFRAHR